MRRAMLLAAAMAFALAMAGGVALADNIEGNGGNNRLVGTNGKDTISGGGGADHIFGRGGADRLFGDSGNDDVHGGKGNDRLQSGLGQDELFGAAGSDFVNAIDGQYNDVVDCGSGDGDVAGIDIELFEGSQRADQFSENCEFVYVGIGPIPGGIFGPASMESRGASSTDLQSIDTRAEAEAAEAEGLLKQIR
jgi:hypothetical protein